MGCEQSTPVGEDDPVAMRYKANLKGVGQTERQISKMQRDAMNSAGGEKNSGGGGGASKKTPPKLDEQGFLMPEEVTKRTFSSISNKEVTLGTLSSVTHCQYAHWTQRGYYPDDPHKQNQDEFGTHLQFAGVERDAMFAVYDGHGKHGHSCAQFAKERLPKAIAKYVRKVRCQKYQKSRPPSQGKKGGWDPYKWPLLTRSEYESCCKKAFLEVNQAMHDASSVVDTLSGTTAVSINFHGNFASICNVGDSRVVLGHRVRGDKESGISIHSPEVAVSSQPADTSEEEKNDIDDELKQAAVGSPVVPGSSFATRQRAAPDTTVVAIPLSKDQTPFRKDERERVKALGASVMSIDQMQGKEEMHEDWGDLVLGETLDLEGDSPRLWFQGRDYPGCAFTRSMGDSMSEAIGVNAVPEILSIELTQNDEYLVVASDGIFEFLTNETVIDLCAASESPLVACEKIVKAAYEQWLTLENRTDDITIVVCFLQNFKPPQAGNTKGTTEELVGTMTRIYGEGSSRMLPPPQSVLALTQKVREPAPDESESADEKEAVAYVSEEALASIIRPSTPPPPRMTCDDPDDDDVSVSDGEAEELLEAIMQASTPPPMTFVNTAVVEVKVDSLEEGGNDNITSKTASVTSVDGSDQVDQMEDKTKKSLDATDTRNAIQV